MKSTFFIQLIPLLAGISLLQAPLLAAPRYVDQEQSVALRETRDTVDTLKHQVNNQESEIRTFQEKFENLSTILESLRDQIQETTNGQKEQLKGASNTLETKIASLENKTKGFAADLKQLQTHANDTTAALAAIKQKITQWDAQMQAQNQNIETLQGTVQTLMDAFQVKLDPGAPAGWTGKTYKVKNGDSLEKIAKANGTSVQALKELNGMSSDKIVVGKTLKLPN